MVYRKVILTAVNSKMIDTHIFVNLITTGGRAESGYAVKMLYAAQKLLARIFSNFMTFSDFYSSKSCAIFEKIAQVILELLIVF